MSACAFAFLMIGKIPNANAACLFNQSGKTVYAQVIANQSGNMKVGNLIVGAAFCVPVSKGNKATVKVTPYAGSRMGCKTEIVGDEEMELVRIGTMNNCTFVPAR
ncbi:MAG: hypothetical protein OIF58_02410 [Cohaesibacter sp.]|nr:hypothetical protein [Cohaesibacter sp.]